MLSVHGVFYAVCQVQLLIAMSKKQCSINLAHQSCDIPHIIFSGYLGGNIFLEVLLDHSGYVFWGYYFFGGWGYFSRGIYCRRMGYGFRGCTHRRFVVCCWKYTRLRNSAKVQNLAKHTTHTASCVQAVFRLFAHDKHLALVCWFDDLGVLFWSGLGRLYSTSSSFDTPSCSIPRMASVLVSSVYVYACVYVYSFVQ